MSRADKPLLTADKQIEHLKSKGVQFGLISEEEALQYLKMNNNYFKLRAFRKNFEKYTTGERAGQYICLDFAMLKDLAIIDMKLRYIALQMALDIEHFIKVKLLFAMEQQGEDGYQIVEDYFNDLQASDAQKQTHRFDTLRNELDRNRDNSYCGGIIQKYDGDYPVWAFVEVIPFGSLIHFYNFCADRFNRKDMKNEFYLLLCIKELRNAAAHNNCILHDMLARDQKGKPDNGMVKKLSMIPRETRDKQFCNERMRQLCTLLYTHSIVVTSDGVHNATKELLKKLVERMERHQEYYIQNPAIQSRFSFIKKAVDIFYN